MRCRMIGGSHHGRSVVVPDPPLDRIQVIEDGPLIWMRTDIRTEQYRLTDWVYRDFRGTVERQVYLQSDMSAEAAQPYICGWFETGVIAPLEVSGV